MVLFFVLRYQLNYHNMIWVYLFLYIFEFKKWKSFWMVSIRIRSTSFRVIQFLSFTCKRKIQICSFIILFWSLSDNSCLICVFNQNLLYFEQQSRYSKCLQGAIFTQNKIKFPAKNFLFTESYHLMFFFLCVIIYK